MPASPVVLRWRPMSAVGLVIAAGGVMFVVLGIVGPKPNPSFVDQAGTSALGVVFAVFGVRGARTKLVLGSTEIVVHNWIATHHVSWQDIDAVTVEPRTGIRIRRYDGQVIKVENPGPAGRC